MRLSEAIRLGSMLRPQVREKYLIADGSCALGAACEAVNLLACDTAIYAYWPFLLRQCSALPREPLDGVMDVGDLVIHLNDSFQWTREQIADWVQTIEPAPEASERPRASRAGVIQATRANVESVGVR